MAKTKKEHYQVKGGKEKMKLVSSLGGLGNMTYREAKRRAVILGMPFPDASSASFPQLMSYIVNTENKPEPELINQYDDWVDKQLETLGYAKDDPIRSYQLRLGFISEDTVTKQRTQKRIKGVIKTPKPKREKDEFGLWKGTKKSYTFELTNKDFSLERITRRVLKKFPDANSKSIQQWYRAALRKRGIDYRTREENDKEKKTHKATESSSIGVKKTNKKKKEILQT